MNDTGLKPMPGFMLLECLDLTNLSVIAIPDKFKSTERDETKQSVIVLEDQTKLALQPGTRVLITEGKGISHRNRKLLFVQAESVMAAYDDPTMVKVSAVQTDLSFITETVKLSS